MNTNTPPAQPDVYDRAQFAHFIEVDAETHPVPPQVGGAGCKAKVHLPFADLEVGQSFTAPRTIKNTVQQYASALTRFTEKRFQIKTLNSQKIRVWRTQ